MKTILSIFFISLISFASYAQEDWDPTDHQIATWQFRSISPSDVANFLSNEDNVYRQAVKNAIAEGRMKHWGLLRKVNGNNNLGGRKIFKLIISILTYVKVIEVADQ